MPALPSFSKYYQVKNERFIMSYLKKSYCFKNTPNGSCMCVYAGHIKKETALKNNFSQVNLVIIDASGRGRGENRSFYAPYFPRMKSFN